MTRDIDPGAVATRMRGVRQIRQYADTPVSDEVLNELLEVARWTGSSRNTQPWHFVVIREPERLNAVAGVRAAINWVASAPLAIALVMNGHSAVSEAYDEGRVTERLLVAAAFFGLGAGTAWFGDDDQQAEAKRILGIPGDRTARSLVAIGEGLTSRDPRPGAVAGGRRPLTEIVSYERFGD